MTTQIGSFCEILDEYRQLIVNNKTGITEEEADGNLEVVAAILQYKTGLRFSVPGAFSLEETKKYNTGPSLIDAEITSTRDLVTESDALVTTSTAKKHYTFLKSIGARRLDMVRSSCDNILLAVKRLPHPLEDVQRQRANFREVRFMKYVKGHPNIVSFVRCTMFKNELWLSMECLMGGTVKQAMSHFQFLEKHIKYIASHVLNGLSFLHSQQMGHRNIRSDHIMFSLNGNVKIIDFSLCCDFSQGPLVHMVGSPWWMSPEMVQSQPHSLPTDLWSFGIFLLEMLNGQPPYRKSSVKALFTTGTVGYPTPPLSRRLRWSPQLLPFLTSVLKHDPRDRPTAAAMLTHKWLKELPRKREMVELIKSFQPVVQKESESAASPTKS